MKKAGFYKKLNNLDVQCLLCNHYCVIKNNEVGFCRARKNMQGDLYSLVYGRPAALNIDPIEKKPLFHFYPGSYAYSLGTYGCNFTCANCQNWDLSQAVSLEKKIKNINQEPPEKIIEEAIANSCKSIAFTYNEPTIFFEYALDIMKLAKQSGLFNVFVSNGFMSEEMLKTALSFLDAVNIDLKSIDDNFYRDNCSARVAPVLKNLIRIKQEQIHTEITTLIIPNLSDDIDMLKQIAQFIAEKLDTETPWHISKFSPNISWKLKHLPETGDDIIYEAYEIGKEAGLKYVYVGNLPGDQRENTYCPKCGELVINRLGYNIERFDIKGCCPHCEQPIDIIE